MGGKKTQSSSTNENNTNNSGGVALSASHQLVNLQQKQQRNNLVKSYHITEENVQPISLYNNKSKPVAAVAPQQVLFEQPSIKQKRASRKRSANDLSTGFV